MWQLQPSALRILIKPWQPLRRQTSPSQCPKSLMATSSYWLIQQNSAALIRSAGCQLGAEGSACGWCREGKPVTCPALMSPADLVGRARCGALTKRALRKPIFLSSVQAPSAVVAGNTVARQRWVIPSWRYLLLLAHWAGSGHLLKLHWNVGPHHFSAIDVRVFVTIRLLWRCFFHDPPTFRCSLFRGDRAVFVRCFFGSKLSDQLTTALATLFGLGCKLN